ncbi:hypothetical protein [Streptosporangium sp. NPDC000396]|uniref:hypothetical protein n=1 Tax=Streptosporangium sp. NPDC000396 TaxID=3366185 RepID=UPI00368377AD
MTDSPLGEMPEELIEFLGQRLAAYERDDERVLHPEVARVLGGTDPTGTMSRAHTEIANLRRRAAGPKALPSRTSASCAGGCRRDGMDKAGST